MSMPTPPPPDVIEAIMGVLAADAAVSALLAGGGGIWDTELDVGEDVNMPRPNIVVRSGGGANTYGHGTLQISDFRVTVICYSNTPHLAKTLYTAVHNALKGMRPTVVAGTNVKWCNPSGGPISLREPHQQWPYVVSSWQVLASELAIT